MTALSEPGVTIVRLRSFVNSAAVVNCEQLRLFSPHPLEKTRELASNGNEVAQRIHTSIDPLYTLTLLIRQHCCMNYRFVYCIFLRRYIGSIRKLWTNLVRCGQRYLV